MTGLAQHRIIFQNGLYHQPLPVEIIFFYITQINQIARSVLIRKKIKVKSFILLLY